MQSTAAACAAASATVSTVPSTGRLTAARASPAAWPSALATTSPSHGAAGPHTSARPRSSWLRMIPEFPQAPSMAPVAAACHTSLGVAVAGSSSTACAADSRVRYRLVPVSASGTG